MTYGLHGRPDAPAVPRVTGSTETACANGARLKSGHTSGLSVASGWHRRNNASPAARRRAKDYASPEHRNRRAAIKAQLARGEVICCWRCGARILSAFHLGHDDTDRRVYRGAECPGCNVKAAARKGAAIANGRARHRVVRAQSRAW